jgi:hypothetical protein
MMDGWMGGWMDGWKDGWMDESHVYSPNSNSAEQVIMRFTILWVSLILWKELCLKHFFLIELSV